MSIIRKSENEIPPMSKDRAEEIKAIPDEDIDFSDILELDEEFFKNAKRVEHPLSRKTDSIVKPHLIDWFKNHAKGKNYEALINDVLEEYVAHHRY
ncbi:hypothetical protein [Gloeocapsa sp. PCC 73106]|uniref:hypothetical protein n=1 Tax=Gloeocapsa sp. PCC 73106 TaxID=102232 RepID=UPI0002AC230C|nr:hypothetical protein [Gloeocapsa sp. PCC 73106]ELR99632.1 hypothetical protein GLO73106DRAFT_00034840 [Gloeocapsa sp. PCC 73106]